MPEYKKKRVNRLRGAPKPKKTARLQREEPDDIIMSPSGGKRTKKPPKPPKTVPDMRVVKGKKLERQRKAKVLLSISAAVTVICLVLHLILPVGILENIQNLTALIGSGGYPLELNSTETLNSVSRGMYYYLLTDTRINAYSNSGREIYSYSHGFENPVMKTSKTRALVFSQGQNQEEITAQLKEKIAQNRSEDLRSGSTGIGPHRDDLEITINGRSVRAFGSQGQQRSSVLALKLAESRCIGDILGERPVILLDDVMSELDQGRQDYLLNHLTGSQIFITCCDKGYFSRLEQGRVFKMEKGRLEQE